MRSFAVMLLLAGCIESSLVPCDETLCPVGTACGPNGSCVSQDQVTACLGLEEHEECELTSGPGVCALGVCEPLICGNGIVTETDEACDDGNNVSGDGCSADCQSRETCGNGVTDVAAGEGCDDGNAVDGDECHADCSLPRCGDGVIDTFEQCETGGTATPTLSCADFGFYEGEVTCGAQCRYTPGGCVGRCGDDEVQEREECDGAPPAFSCADQGFDYGVLTCSDVCTADLTGSCDRFGWREVVRVLDRPVQIRGDGDTLVTWSADRATIYRDGAPQVVPRNRPLVDGDVANDAVMLIEAGLVIVYRSAGATELPFVDGVIVDGSLDPDETPSLLVTNAGNCSVQRFVGGTWVSTPMPATCAHLFSLGNGEYAVSSSSQLTWIHGGVTTTAAVDYEIYDVVRKDEATLIVYSGYDGTVVRSEVRADGLERAPRTIAQFVSPTRIAIHRDAAFAIEQVIGGGIVYRSDQRRTEQLDAPVTTERPILGTTRDGRLLLYSNHRLWEPRPMITTQRVFDSGTVNVEDAALAFGADGSLVVCGTTISVYTGSVRALLSMGVACRTAAARSATDFFVGGLSSGYVDEIRHYTEAGGLVTEAQPGETILQIAVDATQAVAITPTRVLQRTGSSWSALPPLPAQCFASHIAISEGELLVACMSQGNASGLYHLTGSTWTRIVIDIINALAALPDGAVAYTGVATRGLRSPGAATFTELPSVGLPIVELAGTAETDLFGSTDEGLWRWDGSVWSPIVLPPGKLTVTPTEIGILFQDGFLGGVEYRGAIRGLD